MADLPPFQTLIDEHAAEVMAVLRGAVGREGAEDAFQETFLAALRAYPSLRDASNLRGWLVTIAHRKAIDQHRARGRAPVPVAEVREEAFTDPDPADGDDLERRRRPAAEAARRGDPALRLRPSPRGDRRGARLLAGGGAPQPARGTETTTQGDRMTATVDKPVTKKSLEALRDRAAAEGLLDVAYATADSPFGTLLLARTPRGLVRLGLPGEDVEAMLADLAGRISPRVLQDPARLDEERRELDDYFAGRRHAFELPIDWQLSNGFLLRARQGIAAIPYGETRTYTDLARAAGNERAVRAAGSACSRNPIPLVVPCHRVLRSDGSLGGYAGGLEMKERLLELEQAP